MDRDTLARYFVSSFKADKLGLLKREIILLNPYRIADVTRAKISKKKKLKQDCIECEFIQFEYTNFMKRHNLITTLF